MKLFHFWRNDFGEQHDHAVVADNMREAATLFIAKYPGQGEVICQRLVNDALLLVGEDCGDRHTVVEWGVEEVALDKAGFVL